MTKMLDGKSIIGAQRSFSYNKLCFRVWKFAPRYEVCTQVWSLHLGLGKESYLSIKFHIHLIKWEQISFLPEFKSSCMGMNQHSLVQNFIPRYIYVWETNPIWSGAEPTKLIYNCKFVICRRVSAARWTWSAQLASWWRRAKSSKFRQEVETTKTDTFSWYDFLNCDRQSYDRVLQCQAFIQIQI
jgi:hypothetical protein